MVLALWFPPISSGFDNFVRRKMSGQCLLATDNSHNGLKCALLAFHPRNSARPAHDNRVAAKELPLESRLTDLRTIDRVNMSTRARASA